MWSLLQCPPTRNIWHWDVYEVSKLLFNQNNINFLIRWICQALWIQATLLLWDEVCSSMKCRSLLSVVSSETPSEYTDQTLSCHPSVLLRTQRHKCHTTPGLKPGLKPTLCWSEIPERERESSALYRWATTGHISGTLRNWTPLVIVKTNFFPWCIPTCV